MSDRPPLIGLRHAALWVRDMERSLPFYREVLGFELEWQPDPENVYLTSGTDNIALHQAQPGHDPSGRQTLDHLGLAVGKAEEVDEWALYLGSHGVEIAQEPRTHRDGARSLYFRDPDGILIQLIHHPPIENQ
jgi:catechol 2,3-dioxygenase-like lactoylglutathione lyase family enzyme